MAGAGTQGHVGRGTVASSAHSGRRAGPRQQGDAQGALHTSTDCDSALHAQLAAQAHSPLCRSREKAATHFHAPESHSVTRNEPGECHTHRVFVNPEEHGALPTPGNSGSCRPAPCCLEEVSLVLLARARLPSDPKGMLPFRPRLCAVETSQGNILAEDLPSGRLPAPRRGSPVEPACGRR